MRKGATSTLITVNHAIYGREQSITTSRVTRSFTSSSTELEDYDTYEDYCEDYDEIESEEDFEKVKDNEFTYLINGEIFVELPMGEAIYLEY